MQSLENMQASMMTVLDHGPTYLEPWLFEGAPMRMLRGLKVHANTVSHARLVALEETFPKTRECLGHPEFNELCRDYIDYPGVTGFSLDQIGRKFAEFLDARLVADEIRDLVRVEWAWLESYHAAEAVPLELADLASLSDAAVLDMEIVLHPSVRTIGFDAPPHEVLVSEAPGLANAAALMIVRPQEQVLMSPLDFAQLAATGYAAEPVRICNLLASLGELQDDTELLPTLISLIGTGAFIGLRGFQA